MRAALCMDCEWLHLFPRPSTAVATAALQHQTETGHATREVEIIRYGNRSYEIRELPAKEAN